jgi:hypothetical protein
MRLLRALAAVGQFFRFAAASPAMPASLSRSSEGQPVHSDVIFIMSRMAVATGSASSAISLALVRLP